MIKSIIETYREPLEDMQSDMDMDRRRENERLNRPRKRKHINPYEIRYITPSEFGWKSIRERTIFRKEIEGDPYDFVALHLARARNSDPRPFRIKDEVKRVPINYPMKMKFKQVTPIMEPFKAMTRPKRKISWLTLYIKSIITVFTLYCVYALFFI